jgi:hypothetical protein
MKGYREGGEAWEDRMITWNAVKGSPGSRKQRGSQNQCRSAAAVVDAEDDVDACGVLRFDSTHRDEEEVEAHLMTFGCGAERRSTASAAVVFGAVS